MVLSTKDLRDSDYIEFLSFIDIEKEKFGCLFFWICSLFATEMVEIEYTCEDLQKL